MRRPELELQACKRSLAVVNFAPIKRAAVSFKLKLLDEPVPDVIPLTKSEKQLKAELEAVIRSGLETFLRVGEALCEIRRRRLFRCQYATFSEYVKTEFALALSSANGLIRNFEIAQNLIADGVQLPPDTLPTTVKPLAGVPADEGLRTAVWGYAQSLSPARTPSSTVIARVVRIVRNELDGTTPSPDTEVNADTGAREAKRLSPSERRLVNPPLRERPFLAPATRLATFPTFNPHLVVAQINGTNQAANAYRICAELVVRLTAVQDCLRNSFPGLMPHA
jgi:hypothetical protein